MAAAELSSSRKLSKSPESGTNVSTSSVRRRLAETTGLVSLLLGFGGCRALSGDGVKVGFRLCSGSGSKEVSSGADGTGKVLVRLERLEKVIEDELSTGGGSTLFEVCPTTKMFHHDH